MIVVTGGVVSEQPGQFNTQEHVDTILETYLMISDVFPNAAIYPILGSQDFWPTNFFPFQNRTEETDYWLRGKKEKYTIESMYLIEQLQSELWKIPTMTLFDNSMTEYGYYTLDSVQYDLSPAQVTDSDGNIISSSTDWDNSPKLANTHFIGLNTQACFAKNTALIETFGDPGDQLEWLQATLLDARNAGASVIIAGNISPGHPTCNRQWSERYNALIDAFQDTVRLQLFGRSEMESFDIFRSLESGKPIAVSHSAAPFNNFNQDISARVYTVNTQNNLPYVADTFTIPDVSKVSQATELEFTLSHSYPSVYSLPDLRPSSYSDFVDRLLNSDGLSTDYTKKSSMNNESNLKQSCNERCRKDLYCQLNYSVNEQSVLCNGYNFSLWQASRYFLGVFQNPWYDIFKADD